MLKIKLQIYLITYNRLEHLKRTFNQILSENSPIKDFDITILDNASNDGTSEYIDEYCNKFSNIKHIRHKVNIGGNASICRAFELGASSGKEYVWVLCDDDYYDWTNWDEVLEQMEQKTDIICVSNYFFPDKEEFKNKVYQIPQLTFVPAGIYRTELINNDVLLSMYENIFTMFQQSCITISAINRNKKIKVLSKPIVFNGLHYADACKAIEYTRGSNDNEEIMKRRRDTKWILGYSNVLSLLENKKLIGDCIYTAVLYPDIYGSLIKFFYEICYWFLRFKRPGLNYFLEIWEVLNIKTKILLLLYILTFALPCYIIYFYSNEHGRNIRILGKTIIRIPKNTKFSL